MKYKIILLLPFTISSLLCGGMFCGTAFADATSPNGTNSDTYKMNMQKAQAESYAKFKNNQDPFSSTSFSLPDKVQNDISQHNFNTLVHGSDFDNGLMMGIFTPPSSSKTPSFHNHFDATGQNYGVNTQEDVANFSFETCVRTQVNSGRGVEDSIDLCKNLNPGAILRKDVQKRQAEIANEPEAISGTFSFHKKINPDNPSSDTKFSNEPLDAPALPDNTPSNGTSSFIHGSSLSLKCDVSRDFRVMFSPECIQSSNDILMNRINTIKGEQSDMPPESAQNTPTHSALHIPLGVTQSTQPEDETPGNDNENNDIFNGKHSLYAAAVRRDSRYNESDFIDRVEASRTPRHSSESTNDEVSGNHGLIQCSWVASAPGDGRATNKSQAVSSIKSCIRRAISDNDEDGSVANISINENGKTSLVECHNHRGHQICQSIGQ